MAVIRRFRIIAVWVTALCLVLLTAGFQVWLRAAVRTRPWYLEGYLASYISECRTASDVFIFHQDCQQLAARAEQVEWRLAAESQKWEFARNFSALTFELLNLCQDAQLLRLRLKLRQQEQKAKVLAMLAVLRSEIDPSGHGGEIWPKFRFYSIDKDRALSLADQAERLCAGGKYSSALEDALRALVSWQRFSEQGDVEFARFADKSLLERWDLQVDRLLRWTTKSGRRAILIDKLEHHCLVLNQGRIEKSYTVNLGRNWYRPKIQSQDASTPEGEYKVKLLNPAGKYGYALMLDYPNAEDRAVFRSRRQNRTIASKALIGGNIEIHGGGRPRVDWTDGCISLVESDMRELFHYAYPGMPVTIVGTTRMASKS